MGSQAHLFRPLRGNIYIIHSDHVIPRVASEISLQAVKPDHFKTDGLQLFPEIFYMFLCEIIRFRLLRPDPTVDMLIHHIYGEFDMAKPVQIEIKRQVETGVVLLVLGSGRNGVCSSNE